KAARQFKGGASSHQAPAARHWRHAVGLRPCNRCDIRCEAEIKAHTEAETKGLTLPGRVSTNPSCGAPRQSLGLVEHNYNIHRRATADRPSGCAQPSAVG